MARWLLALAVVAAMAVPARADVHRRKVATALSAAGAGVSAGLVLSSFFVGAPSTVNTPLFVTGLATSVVTPSLGELYAHQYLTIGEAIRVGAVALAVYGVTRTQNVDCNEVMITQTCTEITGAGVAMLGIAAIVYAGGAVYDILDAENAVDRYDLRVSVVPIAVPSGGGLAVTGRW
jgi:hypothetical protein